MIMILFVLVMAYESQGLRLLTNGEPPPSLPRNFCKCFSVCTQDGALSFVNSLPSQITDDSSPWYGYLQAVYSQSVQLPYDMSKLRFIYHHDATWAQQNPNVAWPMPPCREGGWLKWGTDLEGIDWCDAMTCEKWHGQQGNLLSENLDIAGFTTWEFYGAHPDSYGSRSFRWSLGHDKDDLYKKNPIHSMHGKTFVEVVRRPMGEQLQGKGAWFSLAAGSGIWIETGKAFFQTSGEHHNYATNIYSCLREAESNLRNEYLLSQNITQVHQDEMDIVSQMKNKFTFYAFKLGYDSVFMTCDNQPEIAYTSPRSMIRDDCGKHGSDAEKLWECGPGESGPCSTGIDLFRGWADQSCTCAVSEDSLNCNALKSLANFHESIDNDYCKRHVCRLHGQDQNMWA